LDKDTLERLRQGERIVEILKQPQFAPLSVERECVILFAVVNKFLSNVKVEKALDFQRELFNEIDIKHSEVFKEIREKKEISAELDAKLRDIITNLKAALGKDYLIG
jgi:F-type H+-transporting ATPase subunit alpha